MDFNVPLTYDIVGSATNGIPDKAFARDILFFYLIKKLHFCLQISGLL